MPIPTKNYARSKVIPELPTSLQFYSTAEVAIILETNVGSVHKWIEQGLLPSVQFNIEKHMLRVRSQDLENFIDAHIRNGLIKPDGLKYRGINENKFPFARFMSTFLDSALFVLRAIFEFTGHGYIFVNMF